MVRFVQQGGTRCLSKSCAGALNQTKAGGCPHMGSKRRMGGAEPRVRTPRRRRKVWLSVFLALALSATVTGIALSAELVTAELDGVANQVTVEQGQSANFTISLSATGNVACGSSH